MKYIVEHLDEDIGKWCCIEYKHMYKQVGDNLIVSNVSPAARKLLPAELPMDERRCGSLGFDPNRVCLLDLRGEKPLTPDEADMFDAVVFGGILGDHPPRDRTGVLRTHGFIKRQLGDRQMSTDTAVLVVKKIMEEGKHLEDIPFVDDVDIKTGEKETTHLPYRYIRADDQGTPLLAPGLFDVLCEDEDF